MFQLLQKRWRSGFQSLMSSRMIALFVFGVSMGCTVGVVLGDRQLTYQHEVKLATESVSSIRAKLEESLYQRLSLLVAIEALAKSHLDVDLHTPSNQHFFQQHFNDFTAILDQEVPGVLSLQLAPDGIVTYVSNVERNRQALGHDLLKDDSRRTQILETINQQGIIVAGPVTLMQGGTALIARKAIFIEGTPYQPERYIDQNRATSDDPWLQTIPANFWGFATVLIEPDLLYQESALEDELAFYNYALRGRHGLGNDGEIFWGDAEVFEKPLTTATVTLPNGEWILGVQLGSGLGWGRSLIILMIGISLSGIVAYSVYIRRESEISLHHSNQALLRATRLKDEFLANMSHELRTPLNAILGMSESLQEEVFGEVTPGQIKALQTIEHSGYHLLSLINDILDLSKIEAGQVQLTLEPTAIGKICRSSLALIQPQASKKNIQVRFSASDALSELEVVLDERRMGQALINLLNNAVKFTPTGGDIALELTCVKEPSRSQNYPRSPQTPVLTNQLHLKVRDTGIGIAPANLDKIFQPFIQLDSALNRTYAGTGLGLALVKRIVELHGGTVWVESQVNVGSTFTICLPCSCVQQTSSTPVLETKLPAYNESLALDKTPVILLVEDNQGNIATISSYLKAKGHHVLVAHNGKEAIALTQTHSPDAIIMDIQMPEMDGLDAIQHLRSESYGQDIPIVAVTALAMKGDRERCLAAGANEYMSKPIKLSALLVTLKTLL